MSGSLSGVIDEMLSGSVAGNIQFESGGGGSNVTITPTLESGTKVADFTIDDTSGSLYAPTPITYSAGTNITIDENGVISATPTEYEAGDNITIEDGVISATDTTYTAGDNITIENGVISAESGGITMEELYTESSPNEHPSTILLAHPISDYKFIIANVNFTSGGRAYNLGACWIATVLNSSSNIGYDMGSGGNVWYSIGNDLQTLTQLQHSGDWHFANIYGVKFNN